MANSIIARYHGRFHQLLENYELTEADIELMDSDQDGKVGYAEFLEFMLVATGKVDREMLDELRIHFDRIDVEEDGFLSREDLVATAKRRLKSPRRKLELARYKEHVIEQARIDRARRHEEIWHPRESMRVIGRSWTNATALFSRRDDSTGSS